MKTVQLKKPHTHNGVLRSPGYFLSLDERAADWLIEQDIAVESRAALVRREPPKIKRGCCGRW